MSAHVIEVTIFTLKWESLAAALAAASALEAGDERFLPYAEAIEEVQFLGHFRG
jgi:hypothetical protein